MGSQLKATMSKERFYDFATQHNKQIAKRKIEKAYSFAKDAHKGQKRASGEPYFNHVFNVATMLVEWQMDTTTICAGLLHDVLEDTPITEHQFQQEFGSEILEIVKGVTKISDISFKDKKEYRAENVRRILFASMKNLRVLFIKLADRLHNMRTLEYLDKNRQKRIAQETLDIYIPVAYKLGFYTIKSEMEDLALRAINEKMYNTLETKMKKRAGKDKILSVALIKIRRLLNKQQMKARIEGRKKNFYSIYDKMKRKKISFEQVRDVYGIRIIVSNRDDCYRALTLIHGKWKPVPNQFDDHIKTPKPNMYRSLHTEVYIGNQTLEIQIRTEEMHHTAEEGIAAHWAYKKTERDKKFDRRISWIKQIFEWGYTKKSTPKLMEQLKIDLFKNEIYVITPKGDPIPLKEGAVPIDFAYRVHTNVGNHCFQAKINGRIMPLNTPLKSGDICEILTAEKAKPSRTWLNVAQTYSARSKIRATLNLHGKTRREQEKKKGKNPLHHIENVTEKLLSIAKCCEWYRGDPIVGYKTKNKKLKIHRKDCLMAKTLHPEKLIDLTYRPAKEREKVNIQIEIKDRVGIFSEILDTFSTNNLRIDAINTRTSKQKTYIVFEVTEEEKVQKLIEELKNIQNILSIEKIIIET